MFDGFRFRSTHPTLAGELNDKGELIGVEILEASKFIRDYILETAQVKLLNLLVAMLPLRATEKVPQIANEINR